MSESLSRRRLLQSISRSARLLLAVPLAECLASFPAVSLEAGTRSKGEDMNIDTPTVDPYRLPRHVMPHRYDLHLEPDLSTATFAGRATVTVTVTTVTHSIILNAVDLTITSAMIEGQAGIRVDAAVLLDDALQRCQLTFAQPITPGEWRLYVVFQGKLNDQLRGFYRSSYKDHAGITQTMAATQFEATDARRAFPCWDEPDFKATFGVTLVVDPDQAALSNAAQIDRSARAD